MFQIILNEPPSRNCIISIFTSFFQSISLPCLYLLTFPHPISLNTYLFYLPTLSLSPYLSPPPLPTYVGFLSPSFVSISLSLLTPFPLSYICILSISLPYLQLLTPPHPLSLHMYPISMYIYLSPSSSFYYLSLNTFLISHSRPLYLYLFISPSPCPSPSPSPSICY